VPSAWATSPPTRCSSRSSGSRPERSPSPWGAGTGGRTAAAGGAAAIAILGWLINGFAPLVNSLDWLKYLSPFYYYEGRDPLTRGIDIMGLVVLGALALVLTALAMVGLERRDLRA
jgi:ABC-2 type transport system permease protein